MAPPPEKVENKCALVEGVKNSEISNSDVLQAETIRRRNVSDKLSNKSKSDGDKYNYDKGNIFARDKSCNKTNVKCSGNAICVGDYDHNADDSNTCVKCQQQKADNLPKLKVYHKREEDNIVKNSSVRAALFEWTPQWFKSLMRDPEHLMFGAKKHTSE